MQTARHVITGNEKNLNKFVAWEDRVWFGTAEPIISYQVYEKALWLSTSYSDVATRSDSYVA